MLLCSQKGRKVSQRGGRSEKMVNIKNEMGKGGTKLAVIKVMKMDEYYQNT